MGGQYGNNSPSHMSYRRPEAFLQEGPPSPEYSNLDCAFPPFPIATTRSATPIQEPIAQDLHLQNDYVKEHAEPYNQSRPASPSLSGHSRSRSVVNSRSRNRSGTMTSRPDPIIRPSTSNGTRRPSLASISGGPRPSRDKPPPLPSTVSGKIVHGAVSYGQSAGFVGLKPGSSGAGALADQATQRRPLSPSRTQTFPLHNEERLSGNGPNSFLARRPSQPLPTPLRGRPTALPDINNQHSFQAQTGGYRANNPQLETSALHIQANMHPPRAASRGSNPPPTGSRPFPVRKASRTDIRIDLTTPSHPPLPLEPTTSFTSLSYQFHAPEASTSSSASSTSHAQISSSRSSPPTANRTLASIQSDTKREIDVASTPLPDLSLPQRPAPSFISPESPTDPLFQQGRLSPIPRFAMNRSPFSTSSSSSASSGASSRYPSSHDLPNRRATGSNSRGVCRGCSQPIIAGQKSISSKDGRLTGRFHKQCFACHTCHNAFETADFYVHDDHPFCAEHYHALNGSLCKGCGKGIEGQYLEAAKTEYQEPKKFHPGCLTCSTCRTSLQDDYYEWMGQVYCERDAKGASDLQMQLPNKAFLAPRPSPVPGSMFSSNGSSSIRPGLPAGPRAGLRAPVPGQAAGPGRGYLSPFPTTVGPGASPAGGRFPERRTTKLMMM
jgi:LIM domain